MRIFFYSLFILINIINQCVAGDFDVRPLSKSLQSTLISTGVWQIGCPVKLDELRLVSVSYYDGLGHVHQNGEIIVHQSAAAAAANVFKQLYLKKFPFTSIDTLVRYHGDLHQAEKENITYGWSCQRDSNQAFSLASTGKVLTINPILNPDIHFLTNKSIGVFPEEGIFAVNRSLKLKGMTESVQSVFLQNGFVRPTLSEDTLGWKNFIFAGEQQNHYLHPIAQQEIVADRKNSARRIFNFEPLSADIKNDLTKTGYWKAGCPVALDRLNRVNMSYYDFNGQTHVGHLIVLDSAVPFVIHAFEELYDKKFPLEPLHDGYNVDTEGTSSFKCRPITGSSSYSLHSFGVAIDINVSRNPYIGSYDQSESDYQVGALIPGELSSFHYLDRSVVRSGMNEKIVDIMKKNAFVEWGGNWQDRIDYMHFQLPTNIAHHVAQMDKESGQQLIELTMTFPESAKQMSSDSRWAYLYEMQPHVFMQTLTKYFSLLGKEKEESVIHLIYEDMAMNRS